MRRLQRPGTPKATETRSALNQDGQAMKAKGRNTRQRLVTATTHLLETLPLRDIRVADIAASAPTSVATFYLYFRGVTDAALAAVNEHSQSAPELLAMIETDGACADLAAARRFVEAYFAVWQRHGAIFRVRNLAAEAGEPGFYAAREEAVRPLLRALTERIARSQAVGRVPAALHPTAAASVVIALLERLSAVVRTEYAADGVSFESISAAAAYLVQATVHGG